MPIFIDMSYERGMCCCVRPAGLALLAALAFLHACASDTTPEVAWSDGVVAEPTGQHAFEMRFDPIPLDQPGVHSFRVDDLPPGMVHALLRIDTPGPDIADAIDAAGLRVHLSLVTSASRGQTPTHQSHDGLLEGEWPRSLTAWNAEPLEYVGTRFFARRHERFVITFTVSMSDPQSPARALQCPLPPGLSATPIIRGGEPIIAPLSSAESELIGLIR